MREMCGETDRKYIIWQDLSKWGPIVVRLTAVGKLLPVLPITSNNMENKQLFSTGQNIFMSLRYL